MKHIVGWSSNASSPRSPAEGGPSHLHETGSVEM